MSKHRYTDQLKPGAKAMLGLRHVRKIERATGVKFHLPRSNDLDALQAALVRYVELVTAGQVNDPQTMPERVIALYDPIASEQWRKDRPRTVGADPYASVRGVR